MSTKCGATSDNDPITYVERGPLGEYSKFDYLRPTIVPELPRKPQLCPLITCRKTHALALAQLNGLH